MDKGQELSPDIIPSRLRMIGEGIVPQEDLKGINRINHL